MLCDSDLSETSTLPVLISVGSNNDFSFETAMHLRYPKMEIHVFDGSVRNPQPPSFVTYHNMNIDSQNVLFFNRFESYILKIDCEGCEFSIFEHLDTKKILQILVEVHGDWSTANKRSQNLYVIKSLMNLLNTTHSVFYAEPNIQFSDGNCIEFSLRRRQSITQARNALPNTRSEPSFEQISR